MNRQSVLIWFAAVFCGVLMAGREALQRMDADARELRLCRTAEQLSAEFTSFREHSAKLPPDNIVKKLVDAELLLPRAAAYRSLVDALKLDARDDFPQQPGFSVPGAALDSAQIAQQMQDWDSEARRRFRCPTLQIPEEYVVKFVSTQPRVQPPAPPLDAVFGPALQRSAQTAAQYRESARADGHVLCRSRDSLAKARAIHDYLQQRCATPTPAKESALNCDAPMRRSQQHLDELQQVVQLNETKFGEKWGRWLDSTAVQCAPGS
jgi:hypothetical protein